jgi:hypothetical protein
MEIITTLRISINQHHWKSLPFGKYLYSSTDGNHYQWGNFHPAAPMEIITTVRISIQQHQCKPSPLRISIQQHLRKSLPLEELPYSNTNGNHYHLESFHTAVQIEIITTM